ncbi:MAG: hypothetical protein QM765_45235 [Myxococcales bacterium]
MNPTVLVYSSHQRCHRLHHDHIVRRALAGNRRILFVAMAETVQDGDEMVRQVQSWESFRWYFDQFRGEGLEASPFYWSSGLKQGDVDLLFKLLWESEVVVLGGGGSANGMGRFLELGARFASGDSGKFGRILHERQARGMLTAGYSAGADQLCSYLFRRTENLPCDAFGLLRDTMILAAPRAGLPRRPAREGGAGPGRDALRRPQRLGPLGDGGHHACGQPLPDDRLRHRQQLGQARGPVARPDPAGRAHRPLLPGRPALGLPGRACAAAHHLAGPAP